MTLREKLFDHPEAFAAGCLVWIPIAVCVLSLIGWMIQGDLDALFGLAGIFIAISLGVATMNPPREEYAPLMFGAVLLTVVVFPALRAALNRRALAQIDFEAMEKAYARVEEKPDNPAARFRLAQLAYARGLQGHATAIAQAAAAGLPKSAYADEIRMTEAWRRLAPPSSFRPLPCPECGHTNPAGLIHCGSCGARFLLDIARGKVVGRGAARKLIAAWAAMMVLMVGIPVATAFAPFAAAGTLLALLAGLGWLLRAAFRIPRQIKTA